jgi:hypothetical protein
VPGRMDKAAAIAARTLLGDSLGACPPLGCGRAAATVDSSVGTWKPFRRSQSSLASNDPLAGRMRDCASATAGFPGTAPPAGDGRPGRGGFLLGSGLFAASAGWAADGSAAVPAAVAGEPATNRRITRPPCRGRRDDLCLLRKGWGSGLRPTLQTAATLWTPPVSLPQPRVISTLNSAVSVSIIGTGGGTGTPAAPSRILGLYLRNKLT